MLELPTYRLPQAKQVLWRMYERSAMFVTKAGKIILYMSILLWFLASFPRTPIEEVAGMRGEEPVVAAVADAPSAGAAGADLEAASLERRHAAAQIRNSFIGQFGRAIEPVMRPLGFDWKISAGIISAFAAREVIISTLATIYSVGDADASTDALGVQLRADRDPRTGEPVFTPLVAVSLLIFFMLACQCMSTLAITRRETNSWRWPAAMFVYMTALAYIASLLVYQGGRFFGLG